MAYHIVGLDIGTRSVRAVLFERSFRGYAVTEVRHATVAPAVEGESEGAPVAAAVASVLGDLPRSQTSVVCAYPLERASVLTLELPFSDPRRIAQTVTFEVEDLVPFDLEDMLFVWRVVHGEANRSEILATLAPRAEVGERLARLKAMGSDPIALLLDSHALGNGLPAQREGATALLDIGHSRTLVSIVRDGVVEHMQSVGVGGRDLTQALADHFGLPFEVAEFLKINRALPSGWTPAPDVAEVATEPGRAAAEGAPEILEALAEAEPTGEVPTLSWRNLTVVEEAGGEPFGEPFGDVDIASVALVDEEPTPAQPAAEEPTRGSPAAPPEIDPFEVDRVLVDAIRALLAPVRASLMGYETGRRREISAVVLAGGTSLLRELTPLASEELGVPAGPLTRLGEDQLQLPGGEPAAPWALAFALGLRGVTDGKLKEVDLRREEFASQGDVNRKRVAVAALAAALLLAVLGGGVLAGLKYRALSSQIADLDTQIATTVAATLPEGAAPPPGDPERSVLLISQQYQELQDKAKVLKVGPDQPPTALKVLKEVSENLSPGEPRAEDWVKVDVDEYSASEATVKIKGTTDSFDATGKIEASMRRSTLFTDVSMGDVTSDRRREDKKNFTLTLTVVREGAEIEDPS